VAFKGMEARGRAPFIKGVHGIPVPQKSAFPVGKKNAIGSLRLHDHASEGTGLLGDAAQKGLVGPFAPGIFFEGAEGVTPAGVDAPVGARGQLEDGGNGRGDMGPTGPVIFEDTIGISKKKGSVGALNDRVDLGMAAVIAGPELPDQGKAGLRIKERGALKRRKKGQ